mgnify:CR=1 FL=1
MVTLRWELIKNKAVRFINSGYQLPQCYISSNPYGGSTGIYSLLGCLAIMNGGAWVVVRFYYNSRYLIQGVILGFNNYQYPIVPANATPWVYIGTNGALYFGDATSSGSMQVSFPLTNGFHTLIGGEYYSGGTYYVFACLDSTSNCQSVSSTSLPQLFGAFNYYQYGYIGTGFGGLANSPLGWYFYNGYIQYIALYGGNSPNIQSQLAQWLQQTGGKSIPPTISGAGPYALYLPISLSTDGSVWFDMSGNNNDATQVITYTAYNNYNPLSMIMTSPGILEILPGE